MLRSLLDVLTEFEIRWKFVLKFPAFSHLCQGFRMFRLFGLSLNDLPDGSTSKPRTLLCYHRESPRISKLRSIGQQMLTKITLDLITCEDRVVRPGLLGFTDIWGHYWMIWMLLWVFCCGFALVVSLCCAIQMTPQVPRHVLFCKLISSIPAMSERRPTRVLQECTSSGAQPCWTAADGSFCYLLVAFVREMRWY